MKPSHSSTSRDNASSPERIFVVDDDPMIRTVISSLLKSAGLAVDTANDGQEAVDWVSLPENHTDLVILDLAMPRMSGAEAMKEIRTRRPKLPIVLCSGSLTDLDATARAGGSTIADVISKPFDTLEFTNRIKLALEARRKVDVSQLIEL